MITSPQIDYPRIANHFENPARRIWSCLYTRDQLLHVLYAWGNRAPQAPKKGKILFFETDSKGSTYRFARVTWSEKKGTYGDRLYLVELV